MHITSNQVVKKGDAYECGNYVLHSDFSVIRNYTNNINLIIVTDMEHFSGPNVIHFQRLPEFAAKKLKINSSELQLDDEKYKIDSCDIYDSDLDFSFLTFEHVKKQCLLLKDMAKSWFKPESLGFLLCKNERFIQQNSVQKAIQMHCKKICKFNTLNELEKISENMKGLGIGLTPSGDDFNCGILYALFILQKTTKQDYAELRKKVYKIALGNNQISNSFLYHAYQGNFYQAFKEGLIGLLWQNEVLPMRNVFASGHASGSDMMTGFLFTILGVKR
jgi:hypothetical protein